MDDNRKQNDPQPLTKEQIEAFMQEVAEENAKDFAQIQAEYAGTAQQAENDVKKP